MSRTYNKGTDMKIMITGALGYLGTQLLSQLVDTDVEIIAIDNSTEAISSRLGSFLYNTKFSFYNVNVTDTQRLNALPKVDLIVHLASVVGYISCNITPGLAHDTNVIGTENIANLNTPVIYLSSGSIYGEIGDVCNEETQINPKSLYAEHKVLGEKAVSRVSNVILRPATLFGCSYKIRDDLLVHTLIQDAVKTNYIDLYQPYARRSFYSVRKMASLLKYICENYSKFEGEVVNVGCETGNLTKRQLCEIISKYTNTDIRIVPGQDLDSRDYNIDYGKLKSLWSEYDENFELHIPQLVRFYENISNRK